MAIHRKVENGWQGIPIDKYKDEPGTWLSVSRRVLSQGSNADFEVRYFEIEPCGHTSFESHDHEHVVVALVGEGRVRLGEEWHNVHTQDVVHVPSRTPHQFSAGPQKPFGILCVVDRNRDKPTLLQPDGAARASEPL